MGKGGNDEDADIHSNSMHTTYGFSSSVIRHLQHVAASWLTTERVPTTAESQQLDSRVKVGGVWRRDEGDGGETRGSERRSWMSAMVE